MMYELPVCQHCACMFTVVSNQDCNVVKVMCMQVAAKRHECAHEWSLASFLQ